MNLRILKSIIRQLCLWDSILRFYQPALSAHAEGKGENGYTAPFFLFFFSDSAEGSLIKARAATDFQCVVTAAVPSRTLIQPSMCRAQ